MFVFALSLSACGKKKTAETVPETSGGLKVSDNLSLMDWLKRGKGVECTVSDPQGTVTVRAMEGKVRIDGMQLASMSDGENLESGSSITTEDWMYMWSGKEGTKMDLKRLEELNQDLGGEDEMQEDEPDTWQDMVASWEESEINYQCQDVRLGNDVFTPPADVNFVDWTAMIEGFANFGQQMEGQSGTGDSIDLKAMEEQAEKLKQQYGIE